MAFASIGLQHQHHRQHVNAHANIVSIIEAVTDRYSFSSKVTALTCLLFRKLAPT